jgi:hypothetical protein
MKQIFAIVLSVIFTVAHSQIKSDTSIVGSVFTGISKDSYRCLLKVNSDGTVCFAYSLRLNEVYSEYKGSIKKLNDTLYHVSVVMNFGQFPQMRLYTRDTIPPYTLHDTDYVFPIHF